MAVIEVEGLWKIFGPAPDEARRLAQEGLSKAEIKAETESVIAVNDATFEVREQEIFVVMGLSGSGKSTLLRCINRLIEPTFGTVEVHDEDVTAYTEGQLRDIRRTKMSMVFQNFGLFPHRTVLGNVEYGLEVAGMSKSERQDKARNTLDLVGLEGYEESRPSELSGGMQQRVGLARALVNDPEILLMDEAALDPLIRDEMQNELLQLQEMWDPAATILFITHDLDEALKMGDRIAIMKDGELAQVGTPTEILTSPADEYVRSFVENVNRTRVLKARTVMRDPREGEEARLRTDSPSVPLDAPLAEILPIVLESKAPVAVRNGQGVLQGVVSRTALLEEVARDSGGHPDPEAVDEVATVRAS